MLRVVAVLIGILAGVPAHAACSVSAAEAIFAPSSSFAVQQGNVAPTSAGAGLRCNGSVITILGSNSSRATMTSANNFHLAKGAEKIRYTVSADPDQSFVFPQGGTIDYFNPQLLSRLTIRNGGTFAPQMHARLAGVANVPAGVYADTLTLQWNWTVCHGIGLGGICVLSESGTGTATIQVSIVVAADCRIAALALSFGSAAFVSQFAEVTQTIRADCTKDTAFSVSLTAGANGSARPWRAMRDGNGNILRYNLYRADGSTIWDESNPLASPIKGTGALTPSTPFTYRARIDAGQASPPAGAYSDVISVLVSF